MELNDQAVIDSYINLLKRGYFPSKYTIKKYKNEKSKEIPYQRWYCNRK